MIENSIPSRTWQDLPRLGILLMLISVLLHIIGNVFEKKLLGIYQVPQMAFFRALLRLTPLFIILITHREIKIIFAIQQPLSHLIRLAVYVSYNCCLLYALSKTSLTTAVSLQYITPFLIILLSTWLLKEKIDKNKWIAIGITSIGLIIALRPSGTFDNISFLVLFASLLGSCNKILIRKLTATEHSLAITIYGNLAIALVSMPATLMDWHPLSWHDLGYFLIAGIFTATAQFTAVQALRFAQASKLALVDYTSIVWCALLDFYIWKMIPNVYLILGACIIVCGNLYLLKSTKTSKEKVIDRMSSEPHGELP